MKRTTGISPENFRQIALSFEGVLESAHMGHPDFRANGRIFATLSYPDEQSGMVKVSPDEQAALVRNEPDVFHPCTGAWGRAGCTNVRLAAAREKTLRAALESAWRMAVNAKRGRKARQRPG